MTVKELIKKLKECPDNAEVMAIVDPSNTEGYQNIIDCETEFVNLVTLGCKAITEDV